MYLILRWAERNEESLCVIAGFQHFGITRFYFYCKERDKRTRQIFFYTSWRFRCPIAFGRLGDVPIPVLEDQLKVLLCPRYLSLL
jgi:hypothetical protein